MGNGQMLKPICDMFLYVNLEESDCLAIDVEEEDIDDDFEPVRYPSKQASGSNATPVKRTKRMIIARSPASETVIKGSEITKGKKRACNDNKMNRNKKKKGETENVAIRDTCAESEAGQE
ncbi:hypothetical protein Tco_1265971 [Tanacetum coccineum]